MGMFDGFAGDIIGAGASLLGGSMGADAAKDNIKRQIKWQKKFAQHGIRWRAADAKAAGLHPLAALGISTSSFNPIPVGQSDYGIGKAGQHIGSAVNTLLSKDQRELKRIKIEQEREALDNMKLKNVGLKKEIQEADNAKTVTIGKSPLERKYGIVGQGSGIIENDLPPDQPISQGFEYKKSQVPYSSKLGVEAGVTPLERNAIDQKGGVWRVPSKDIQETLESSWFHQGKYLISRGVDYSKGLMYFNWPNSKSAAKHRQMLRKMRPKNPPKGYEYRYNVWKGGYVLRPKKGRSLLYDSKYYTFPN